MKIQTIEEKKQEIEFQTRMLKNLRSWILVLFVLSSVFVALSYWAFAIGHHKVCGIIAVVMAVILLILIIIVGLGYRNGKQNLDKIIASLSQRKDKT